MVGNLTQRVQDLETAKRESATELKDLIRAELENFNFMAKIDKDELRSTLNFEKEVRDLAEDVIENAESVNRCDETHQETIQQLKEDVENLKKDNIQIVSDAYDEKLTTLTEKFDALERLISSTGSPSLTNETTTAEFQATTIDSNTSRSNLPDKLDLLICFDSNWKFIDHKKLWKMNGSSVKRCGTLFDVSKVLSSPSLKELKYFLLNVGTNDLDDGKDHQQVFGELELMLHGMRTRFPGVKFIISELLPRNDNLDTEVLRFNELLSAYASRYNDVTLAIHKTLRDVSYSHFFDAKHVKKEKVPKFAANLIKALLSSYNIRSKSELFPMRTTTDRPDRDGNGMGLMNRPHFMPYTRFQSQSNTSSQDSNGTSYKPSDTAGVTFPHPTPNTWERNIGDRMKNIAGYHSPTQNGVVNNCVDNIASHGSTQNNVNNGADNIVRGVLLKLGNFIQQCV